MVLCGCLPVAMWAPQMIAKLVQITPISLWFVLLIAIPLGLLLTRAFTPTYITTGAPHGMEIWTAMDHLPEDAAEKQLTKSAFEHREDACSHHVIKVLPSGKSLQFAIGNGHGQSGVSDSKW